MLETARVEVEGIIIYILSETRARVNHLTLGRSMGERPESLRDLNRLITAAANRGAVVACYGHPLVRFFRPPTPAHAGVCILC